MQPKARAPILSFTSSISANGSLGSIQLPKRPSSSAISVSGMGIASPRYKGSIYAPSLVKHFSSNDPGYSKQYNWTPTRARAVRPSVPIVSSRVSTNVENVPGIYVDVESIMESISSVSTFPLARLGSNAKEIGRAHV